MTRTTVIPDQLVPASYTHDPDAETVLFGDKLREGMVVVLKYPFFRANPDKKQVAHQLPTPLVELHEKARWCRIERLESIENDVVTFIAEYADGVTLARRYSVTMEWYVKKESLPSS